MVLDFYADDSLVGASVNSFDAVVTFDTGEASYESTDFSSDYLLALANNVDGVVTIGGGSISGGSSSNPIFTMNLTDQNMSEDLVVYVSGVSINDVTLDGSTLLIA